MQEVGTRTNATTKASSTTNPGTTKHVYQHGYQQSGEGTTCHSRHWHNAKICIAHSSRVCWQRSSRWKPKISSLKVILVTHVIHIWDKIKVFLLLNFSCYQTLHRVILSFSQAFTEKKTFERVIILFSSSFCRYCNCSVPWKVFMQVCINWYVYITYSMNCCSNTW